jgi:purine nucleosidase
MPLRIVLDTDIGTDVDDALCLALALAAPELALAAVTCVSGDTRRRAQIARRLLDLGGHPNVPVYAGRRIPLDHGERFVWLGHEGTGILDDGVPAPVPDDDAVEVLCRLFHEHERLELVTVGPLTNVAAALGADTALPGRIARLTVMGGYLRGVSYGGASFPVSIDYNLCADPDAARQVLSAGIATRLVPTDVTMQVWLEARDVRALDASRDALHRALARALRQWTPGMNAYLESSGARPGIDNAALLHDPLALACAYDESFCTFEDLWLEPRIEDGILRLVERPPAAPGASQIRCATAVDAPRFLAHVRARLGVAA